jgi:hypothetical protein
LIALRPYLSQTTDTSSGKDSAGGKASFTRKVSSFMDKDRRQARISVNMKDIGSEQLPFI